MIGLLRSLHTSFYFPFKDRSNICFDLKQSHENAGLNGPQETGVSSNSPRLAPMPISSDASTLGREAGNGKDDAGCRCPVRSRAAFDRSSV